MFRNNYDNDSVTFSPQGRIPPHLRPRHPPLRDHLPHLFEFQPSGVTQEMVACGIGARSQMARTYLERHLDEFEGASREELIKHALRSLKESLSQDKELTVDNTSVGIGGIGESFALYEGQDVAEWLNTTFENQEGGNDEEGGEAMEL